MMLAPLTAWLLTTALGAPAPQDSLPSHPPVHIVREFAPVTVVGGRRNDRYSTESVQTITREAIRTLPVDRLSDAIALQAGVVAVGEDLHVRGGRAGELATTIGGIALNEVSRGTAMEVPLFAVRAAELLSGGLDADHAGSLAGELDLQTEVPEAHRTWLVRWNSDGRYGSGFDAAHARASTPLGSSGLGIVVAGEARLDDMGMPSTRSRGRTHVLGQSFGWRQDNHLLGWAKLASVASPQRASIEVLTQRIVRQPYDPMFSFDGWVSFGSAGETGGNPLLGTSDHQVNSGWQRYRAADHKVMTEDRRWAAIATLAATSTTTPARLTLGYTRARSLTSVGLRGNDGYITNANRIMFGPYDDAGADPFHAYFGDEPYFRLATNSTWTLRGDASRRAGLRHMLRAGAGATYEEAQLYEHDDAAPVILVADKVREYHAWAPGGFAYVQHRWDFGGLVWNGGLRLQLFDAGPQAGGSRPIASWSPRAGFAYPVSDRDVFSLSYSRIFQNPPRDLLYENRRLGYDRHPMGNGALIPSEVLSWQAAVKHILDPAWSLQLSAFARDVYGEPGTRNVPVFTSQFRLQYTSDDVAHAQGFELSLLKNLPGRQRYELAYTFLNAWGTQSNLEGLAYGSPLGGARPLPTGERPLDWDEHHSIALSAQLHTHRQWDLSWSTRLATGRPWTPVYRIGNETNVWPPAYSDQSLLNSRRFELSENTQVAARWKPRMLRGGRAMLMVTNVFNGVRDTRATLSGYPNPHINTLYDEYGAYRTEMGGGGGAYWNDSNGDGIREWVPVNDARLRAPRRSVRFGVEFGM